MKNTARTTVREGRQSSDNIYVRIAAAEQNCLQAMSEHQQWWSGGHIRRQTVPDVGISDREGPGSDCRQAVWRHNELVRRWRSHCFHLAINKSHCLLTEAYMCEKDVYSCYTTVQWAGVRPTTSWWRVRHLTISLSCQCFSALNWR